MAKKNKKTANELLNSVLTLPWGDVGKAIIENKPVVDNALNVLKSKLPSKPKVKEEITSEASGLLSLFKKAESYGGGSSGSDFLSTMDGSETLQDGINTNEPSNGDGQGATPAGGQANHPVTPLGEQGHEKPNQSGEAPFNEALVDDNHSNSDGGVAASKMMNLFIKTANEEQYADINSPEVAAPASIINNIKNKYQDKIISRRPMKHQPKPDMNIKPGDKIDLDDYGPGVMQQMYRTEKKPGKIDFQSIKPYEFESGDMRQGPYDNNGLDIMMNQSPKGLPYSLNMLNIFKKQADETNFFLEGSPGGGVADSPQTGEKNNNKEDGHAFEELSDPYSLQDVINNTPHPSNEADLPMAEDPGIVDTNKDREDVNPNATPDIYKGKTFAHLKSRPFITTSIAASQFKKKVAFNEADDTAYKNVSNVGDIMSPDENQVKHDKATHDFGTGDQFADTRIEEDAPLQGNEITEESKNYSGIDNTTAGLLGLFIKISDKEKHPEWYDEKNGKLKCGNCGSTKNDIRGRLCDKCMMKKKASSEEPKYLHEDITNEDGTLEGNHPWLDHPYAKAGKVDMLPIKWLKQFKGNELRPDELEPLQKDIAENGIKEPLQLGIGQKDRQVTLGEGNHRLQAAENLGYTHVPVRGYRMSQQYNGIPYDKMSRVPNNDYFPADFAPREAFDEWSHLRQPKKKTNIDKTAILNLFKRKADYGGVVPSANPNSGLDENEEDDFQDTHGVTHSETGKAMIDGKNTSGNEGDKVFDDPAEYRKTINYNRNRAPSEDENKDYFKFYNSGEGGTGQEGDGQNFSGVNNA